ncbi:MAG: HIT family protein [Dehalococcoidia bacterium]|jgi:histidine triad (HIT) family protein|nr:HIT family protein [Dehalococcoidia bacterium]
MHEPGCPFCQIEQGETEGFIVLEAEHTLAFLDIRPVFPGHVLLIPRVHYETLPDIPPELFVPLMSDAQLLARAVVDGLGAEGSFVAINNRVSQSVPHLHIHIVPRTRGDGLRGFFWPRHPYENEAQAQDLQRRLSAAVDRLRE